MAEHREEKNRKSVFVLGTKKGAFQPPFRHGLLFGKHCHDGIQLLFHGLDFGRTATA